MTTLELGKLYTCQKHLLIYPTINAARGGLRAEIAVAEAHVAVDPAAACAVAANYWSRQLNCQITLSEPNEVFMVVDQKQINDKVFYKILLREKLGWFIWKEWLGIHAINN